MSKYNFDCLPNRKNTNSCKYDEFNSSLPMWVADMDFPVAPKIKEAIQKDLDLGIIGYTLVPESYFEAFSSFYHLRYNTDFDKEELIYVSGVVASIDSMLKIFCTKDDNVLMLSPIYHTFYHCIDNYCHYITSKMIEDDGQYHIDFADLENKLKLPHTKILLLCNPHNPVGKIFTKEELEKIDELASKYDVMVISDEIHGLITNPGKKYLPYSNVAKGKYVTCLATSKAFNLAGLQSAVVLCKDKELRQLIQKQFYKDDIGEPNYFACNANIAALKESEDWLDEMNRYVYQNKIDFKKYVDGHISHVKVILTDATYMVWVDVRYYVNDSKDFCKKLNKETGLLVSPGAQFGDGGEGFFRINLATSHDNCLSAARRLESFLNR